MKALIFICLVLIVSCKTTEVKPQRIGKRLNTEEGR